MARPHAVDELPEWRLVLEFVSSLCFLTFSIHGVAIPLELLKLLAVLKDHSRPHKELYWRYLKVIELP